MKRWVLFALAFVAAGAGAQDRLSFDESERRAIQRHGPWPPEVQRDASNRVSGNPDAIELGRRLFFDVRMSGNGAVSCASCHRPEASWTDGRATAVALGRLTRNTPSLWNVGLIRWFGWGGEADSIWAQNLRALLDPRELGSSPAQVAKLLRGDPELSCLHARAYGAIAGADDERTLADAGKALAAFVESLRSARTPFDEFRDALARGDAGAASHYPLAAQRGLKIFVGRGQCNVCHFGPAFTHGEFHDVGMPYFVPGGVDSGRYEGIRTLRENPYNLLGPHNDDRSGAAATKTRHVDLQPRNFGEFKVPGLRNVALSAPYMHDGRLATLHEVVRHYSELNVDRLHADGEQLLKPLRLSAAEIDDVVAFLHTLTDPRVADLAHARSQGGGQGPVQTCVPLGARGLMGDIFQTALQHKQRIVAPRSPHGLH